VLIVPEAVGVPVEESVAVAVLLGVDEVEGVEVTVSDGVGTWSG